MQGDGSAVLRDADGAAVAGAVATGGARLTPTDGDRVLTLVGPTATDGADGAPGAWVTGVAVEATEWGEREGGRSLAVTPSAWARGGGAAARELLWAQLVAAQPEADTPSMQAQLECHELGAPDKATWNLEPWRPEVDGVEMIRSRCNP